MFESRYRKFSPAAASDPLTVEEHALAALFDGARDSAAVRAEAERALNRRIGAAELEGFAAQLAQAGLLKPGSPEPLPPPAFTDKEAAALGWNGDAPSIPAREAGAALPPSTMPGSRGNPGFFGSVTGLVTGSRGEANRLDYELPPGVFSAFGQTLIWPLVSKPALYLFLALLAGAIAALLAHRLEFLDSATGLFKGYQPVPIWLLAILLVNFFASSARAAAIARYTPERPRVGIVLGFLRVPRLFVDSGGTAERAARADRLRVAGAGAVGTLTLALLGVLLWFLTYTTQPVLGRIGFAMVSAALVVALFRLNPLVRGDGHFLMANALGVLDLRDQALLAMFGYDRPWSNQTRKLSRGALRIYAAAAIAYIVFTLVMTFAFAGRWLAERFQGIGFLLLVGFIGAYMFKQFRGIKPTRSDLGVTKTSWRPARRTQWLLGAALLVGLLPYRYEPSGDFTILPRQQADVRALVAGDVQEVLVKEGDLVAAGQVIARLADAESRARVAASEAALAQARADLVLAKKGAKNEEIELARQRVNTAQKQAQVAREAARRTESAYKARSVTAQEYDRAQGAADVAEQQLLEARKNLELVGSPAMAERITAIEAQVARYEAELAHHRQQMEATQITAPIAGRVVSGDLQFARGRYLQRGDLLATIADTEELLAEIKVPESVIGDVEVDTKAWAKPWAFPGDSFEGVVRSIAPAAEDGEYGKVVRVQMVVADPDGRLRAGMTGNAKIRGHWHMTIVVFTRALSRFLFVEVWSWLP